jgi:hypothetical protein
MFTRRFSSHAPVPGKLGSKVSWDRQVAATFSANRSRLIVLGQSFSANQIN